MRRSVTDRLETRGVAKRAHVHYMVAQTAREMCEAQYELSMRDNLVRGAWKKMHPDAPERALRRAFLRKYLGTFIGPARATLAHMLGRPDVDGTMKETIYEALLLDATLVRGRLDNSISRG